MQIVSDSGADLDPEQLQGLDIHFVPLVITLDEKSYRSGVDIAHKDFYKVLTQSNSLPTTSQPSAGEFAELYQKLAADDPNIFSVHISSGLSGTIKSAQAGAQLVPEANITVIDTKTLSSAQGWQVEAVARAVKAGWAEQRIQLLAKQVSAATDTIFTLSDLKYLIHGGRISHLRGLLASLLNIKPIIGVEKEGGMYTERGRARSFSGAVKKLVDIVTRQHTAGSPLRVQVMHADNPQGAIMLKEILDQRFDCTFLPTTPIAPVLGAHTGPSLVGIAYASMESFPDLP